MVQHNVLKLSAFNLWHGATFHHSNTAYVVKHLQRFDDSEKVLVFTRELHFDKGMTRMDDDVPFLFLYNEIVTVVGHVVEHLDPDDNNCGNDLA